jgi:O-antigen/teichoic acid export membrane protein
MQSRRKPRCGEDYTSTMAVLIGRIGFITIGFSEPIFGQGHILGGEVVYHELATKIQFVSICLPFCLRISTPNGNFYRHGLKLKA